MNFIELRKLKKIYKSGEVETPALVDVSLEIKQGEFISIMGPSGAGKSTMLHILGFLDRPTSGHYFFEGKDMEKYSDEELAHLRNQKIGFVFQDFNLLGRTSVLENVKLPLLYSHIPQKTWNDLATQAITAVGLEHRMHHEPSQLSGGEKQRVAIARALVCNPQIIFADEPTGNLDSKSGEAVMQIIQNMHEKEKRTVILITHETNTAHYAERLIMMHDGHIQKDEAIQNRITYAPHHLK